MNVVSKILPDTSAILCYFHIGKNVKVKCIANCRVKVNPKDVKVNEKEVKEVKEEKASDVVHKVMSAWKDLVESPTEDSCKCSKAIQRCMQTISKFPCIC